MFKSRLLVLSLALMFSACQQNNGAQTAEELARKYMTEAIGVNAVNRAKIEIRSYETGWQVIFRDADASCEEGAFWLGACRFGPRTFRDVYVCVNANLVVDGAGASEIPDSLSEQVVCHAMQSGPTVAPAPTFVPVTSQP